MEINALKSYLGITLKKRTTKLNLWALPLIFCIALESMAFFNTASLSLLKSDDYFNIDEGQIGRVSSQVIFWATIVSLPTSVAAGYLYDLFGRKKTIFMAFVALSVAIFCLPYLSKVWELAVCRSTL